MSSPREQLQPGSGAPKKKSPLVWVLAGCALCAVIAGLAASVFFWWGYQKAKGFAKQALDSGDMNNVAELWSDVPRMEGMTKSQQVDMPAGLKLLARPILNTMMRGVNDGKDAGQWDWTAFSVNGKAPSDVQAFYVPSRMAEYGGWQPEGGCAGYPAGMSGDQATFCAFQKKQGDQSTGLLVIAAGDKEHGAVSIFFIRQDAREPAPAVGSPPVASGVPSPIGPTLAGAPYPIDRRPMPGDLGLDVLLPREVGTFTRVGLRQLGSSVTPVAARVDDGNPIYADYRSGDKKIFMELGVYAKPESAQEALRTAAGDAAGGVFPTDPRFGAIGQEPSYLKVIDSSGAFFAWTRGGYYFSAQAPSETVLEEFMEAFPY